MEVKIKVLKVFLFITIVIILIMGVTIFMTSSNKSSYMEETEVLKAEIEKLKTEKSVLEAKITAISNIVNESNEVQETEKNIKIEGIFEVQGQKNTEGQTYTFKGNEVEYNSLETVKGIFEVKNNKIKITYKEAFGPDGEKLKELPAIESEELIIIDENTLELNGIKIIKK